jgi:death-on-curing protein
LFGQDAYPSIYLKAAALMESIILNHPMIDGNKRSSWFGLNAFLLLNGIVIEADQVEAYEFVLVIATKKIDIESSANWIEKHSRKL